MTAGTTTRARAWRLHRADGLVLGFTDHDRDLQFEDTTFRAGAGMTAKALSLSTGLSVDNTEAAGALSDAGLTEADVLAGRWDGARLTIWEVDWTDPAARRVLFRGTLGEIERRGGAFRAELRGLAEALQQGTGRIFGAACPAVLGDARCRFDLSAPGFSAQVPLANVAGGGADLMVPALPGTAAGWFAEGCVRFLSGAAAGLAAVIRSDVITPEGRRLALWAAPGTMPAAGDAVLLQAGCDKRLSTCRDKFGNVINFQAFPHVPAEDWLLASPQPGARGGRRDAV